ncbi:MAG: response regulator transcription factor [Salibacteraceae bacterium]
MSYRILLVDDEEALRDNIRLLLELEGYEVTDAEDGKSGLEAFHKGRWDLVVLDVMMPQMDGFEVCSAIRRVNSRVPVLFLTAKNEGDDRVEGLRLGADDYLTKPFNLEEFLLRAKNLIRRGAEASGGGQEFETYSFGNNTVNFVTYEIQGQNCMKNTITKREFMLLRLLFERKNQVVSREDILEKVWGYDIFPSTRTIDNYILAFR